MQSAFASICENVISKSSLNSVEVIVNKLIFYNE